jgi:hypothetical protein
MHPIYMYNAKKNIGIYKYKKVYIMHTVVLTYYGIKFIDLPLFVLYVCCYMHTNI